MALKPFINLILDICVIIFIIGGQLFINRYFDNKRIKILLLLLLYVELLSYFNTSIFFYKPSFHWGVSFNVSRQRNRLNLKLKGIEGRYVEGNKKQFARLIKGTKMRARAGSLNDVA